MNHMQGVACEDAKGKLPSCGCLAYPYIPVQQQNSAMYQAPKALVRGTIYPGLDLPFMNMVNQKDLNATPLHQLQALNFAITELGMYLDTHADDRDATDLYNRYVEQYAEAVQQYEQRNGSLTQMGSAMSGTYQWTNDPWPWEYDANKEG